MSAELETPATEEEDAIVGHYDAHARAEEVIVEPEAEAQGDPAETPPGETTEQPAVEETPAAPVIVPAATPAERPVAEAADPFAALGLSKDDPYIKKFIEAYKAGDHLNFQKVFGTDWDKVPDLEVIRKNLEQQYSALEPKKRDFMINREMAKYNSDSFDDEEKMAAEIGAELEANKIRDGFKAQQEQYKIPERSTGPSAEEIAAQQAEQAKVAEFEAKLMADPALKAFETNRTIKVGKGEDAFNFKADPTIDVQKSLRGHFVEEYFKDENGVKTFDMEKFLLVRTIARDPQKFLKEYSKVERDLAVRDYEARLRNAGAITPSAPSETAGEDSIVGTYRRN